MPETLDHLPAVAEPRQVQRVEPADNLPAAAPTVEQILLAAIEKGIVPDALEKLVALQERVEAKRAEKAFNSAMAAFKQECPAILKTRTASFSTKSGGSASYKFVDLEELTKTIDPHLHKHGLFCSWDTTLTNELLVVTCTVRHVDGHRESAKFASKVSGTPLMSPGQQTAATATFGRRHSMLCVLGLVADLDNDDRRPEPSPKPDADPSQPKVPTRSERNAPRVSVETLNGLFTRWQETRGNGGGTLADFASWAKVTLGTECDLTKPSNWDEDAVDVIRSALQ